MGRGEGARLPKGVTLLDRDRGGRRYLARIRPGRGAGEIHLGLYETAGRAGFAFRAAAEAIGRPSGPGPDAEPGDQPDADEVRRITGLVRRRLGLDRASRRPVEVPPEAGELLTLFEVAVVGFWRHQAAQGGAEADVDAAGRRVAESARLMFWSPRLGHPEPAAALADLLGRRLDAGFRRGDLARAILDDDEDDDWRVGRWLALPDAFPSARGFRDEVRHRYADLFEPADDAAGTAPGRAHWAAVLGIDPPYSTAKVRDAYRARSLAAHPDRGGTHAEFVRLRVAHDEGREYCRILGI